MTKFEATVTFLLLLISLKLTYIMFLLKNWRKLDD